jgi:hypothetical protein
VLQSTWKPHLRIGRAPDRGYLPVHAGVGAITAPAERQTPESQAPGPQDEGASAETSSAKALTALKETIPLLTFPVSHPAYLERCHIEDGPARHLESHRRREAAAYVRNDQFFSLPSA